MRPIVTGGTQTSVIHCDYMYVLKKLNKRLYIARQLFKCGLAKSEIVNV